MKYRDRIIGTVRVRGDRLLPHPKNWRVHPENQRDAMRGVLADLGVARSLTGVPAAPGAEVLYREERARGAVLAVYGPAPWADGVDVVDPGTAAFLALYADRVIGGGLPRALA